MKKGKVIIFISYAQEDHDLMEYLKVRINSKPKLNAIVVPDLKDNLEHNDAKIITSINGSKIFLPILTVNSISNQWVNQEIGFAFCFKNKSVKSEIVPLIEKEISSQLKGFISKGRDLNYRYSSDKTSFESVADDLVNDLVERFKNYGVYDVY